MGRVSDILGRRTAYVGALGLFLIGSIWVPLAEGLPAFLAARALTALGGGAMVPIGMAVIGDLYPALRRPAALGILGAVDTAGWVWGPLYGALLVRLLSWRWQFYLNVPLSLVGMAAAWWAMRDLPRRVKRPRLDWVGLLLLTAGLLALNLALLGGNAVQAVASLSELEARSAAPPALYGLALLLLVGFGWWERRQDEPLIDPALHRRRPFAAASLLNFLIGGVLIIAMVNVPLFVNVREIDLGRAAVRSGWLLSALTLAMAVGAYVGGRIAARGGYRAAAAPGAALCAGAFALLGGTWSIGTPYAAMAWQLALLGVGFGLITAPVGAAAIDAAPARQRGMAAALVIVWRLLGMAVGLAGLTAWGLARFEVLRTGISLPALTDPEFAAAVARGLAETTARVLTETFLISAGIAALAVPVALLLRRATPMDEV